MNFQSNHTVCDEVDGTKRCVELFFDKHMRLLNLSEPYFMKEGEHVIIHKDGFLVETRKFTDLEIEQIKELTHTGFPTEEQIEARRIQEEKGLSPEEIERRTPREDPEESQEGGCSSCAENAKKKKAGMLKRLAKGVPGLLKSELGIDQAELAVVEKRKSICLDCPEGIYNFGVCDEDRGGCGCFLASKVTIEGESCPKGHW